MIHLIKIVHNRNCNYNRNQRNPKIHHLSPKKARWAQKSRARKLIRQLAWSVSLPGLWFISVVKWAEQRREEELNVLSDEIPENLEVYSLIISQEI